MPGTSWEAKSQRTDASPRYGATELADAKRDSDAMAARVKQLRADLRDSIEASGKVGIRTETSEGGKVSASISKKGTLTIRGI